MSNCLLIILVIGSCVIFGGFPSTTHLSPIGSSGQIFPDYPVDETSIDWSDSVGFTTVNSLYLVYQALFTISLADSFFG